MILETDERIKEYTDNGAFVEETMNDLLKETVKRYPEKVALVDP